MDSRARFVIAAFLMAAAVVFSNANCGADEPWPPQRIADTAYAGSISPQQILLSPIDDLCMDADSSIEGDILLKAATDPEACPDAVFNFSFIVERDFPQAVVLYGLQHVEYCIAVLRLSGYITISHPSGEVRREGDRFTWCVVPADEKEAETMLIRSLTARAEVEVSVL